MILTNFDQYIGDIIAETKNISHFSHIQFPNFKLTKRSHDSWWASRQCSVPRNSALGWTGE